MVRFKTIRYKNFLSVGNKFIEIWLDYRPTTLIVGESGSGKSSISDALCFALFNKPFRPIHKNQLINAINDCDCLVEIEFEIGNNKYKVRRGIKPTIFEIFCNNILVNQDAHSKDYQEHLEKNILGFNFRTFSHIVVLGAVNFVPFMELKPNDRRVLIEDLLDIQIFSVMGNILKQRISDNKTNTLQNSLFITNQKEKITLYENYIKNIKKDRQNKIEENNKTVAENLDKIGQISQSIFNQEEKIKALKFEIQDEKEVLNQYSTVGDYQRSILGHLKKANKDVIFYENNNECPTCEREFGEEYKNKTLTQKKAKIEEYNAGLYKLKQVRETQENRIDAIELVKLAIKNENKSIEEFLNSIDVLKMFNKKLYDENNSLVEETSFTDEEQKNKDLVEQLKTLENDKECLSNQKQLFELAANLLKDGGIKTRIIRQYLPIINKLVNRFLSAMNFYVSFSIDENFQETIKSRGRDDFTYACFSEGERQRLDVAILLTWRTIAMMKNSIHTNLLFIDELLDSSLDQVATENIIELINTEPVLSKSNIFVISHKINMIDKFSEYIKFEKYKNFSRLLP
jgi:DNA repair exonuclease SbcCD ATPase subunit